MYNQSLEMTRKAEHFSYIVGGNVTTLKAICDDCGKEISSGEIYPDYDGIDRCKECDLKSKLYSAEREYNSKLELLKNTHIKDLKKLKSQIAHIKSELSQECVELRNHDVPV